MPDVAQKTSEYLDGKLWFQRSGSTTVTIGMTNLAIEDIGEVESVEFPNAGDDFKKGDVVATVDGTQGSLEVIAPASGIVQEVNDAVQEEPERVSDDPLEEGWLFTFEVNEASELKA